MGKPRVYLETTVISYAAAFASRDLVVMAHQQITREWMSEQLESYDVFVSQLVITEAAGGNEDAAKRRLAVIKDIEVLALTNEAQNLTQALLDQRVVPKQALEDALHIALATVHGMDYLLTWNCRHIANASMRIKIETVCRNSGYEPPVICTPEELVDET